MKSSSDRRIIPAAEVESDQVLDYKLSDLSDPGFNPQKPRAKSKAPAEPQLTAAALEKIQKEAYDEAYEQGRKEGFEFGHNEAREQSRQDFQEKLKAFESILGVFEKPFNDLDDQVESEIVELVISMVKQLVRREIKMDPGHIVGVVREALAVLPVAARDISVLLNPADAELIREAYSLSDREEKWSIVEEPTMASGGCKIQAQDSCVDATLESRLDAMIAPLLSDERHSANASADNTATDGQSDE